MERLTIKELAPYLPYDLKGVDYFQGHRLIRDITLHNVMSIVDGDTKLKPLLRHIYSLTEEIEHNGERFIPINKLKHLYGWDYLWYEVLGEITNFNVNKLKYACLKLLLEWHFDVFGLTDRGLALPIDGKEVEGE